MVVVPHSHQLPRQLQSQLLPLWKPRAWMPPRSQAVTLQVDKNCEHLHS